MTDFTGMLSQAKAMQEKIKKVQEDIKKIEVEGVSGGGLVKVKLSGEHEMKMISIAPEAKAESQELINDLIIAAYNDAKDKLKKESAQKLLEVTGGIKLPFDLKFPL